ncbi:hypothetical protein CC80DRAFT_507031 [Byssothecium circinans]|uniref:Uncharacterized protein n=1 Tax=Byssothecium circinans TaxID=147558 RepID=A0A6A5TM95_9PLEO|nr:hypothetical protein CC80DRAFT_507031 [Byssothecium circinans]
MGNLLTTESALKVFAAVAAVVSAFHQGAELISQIDRSRLRRDSNSEDDHEDERRRLQVSLETAESLIGYRYAADIDKVGDIGLGDDIARDRLFHIAVTVQTNIVQSLQLAVKYENAVLDLPSLHEASILNRKDTIDALDELKYRVLLEHPLQRTASQASPRISRDSRGSIVSVLPSRTAALDTHNPRPVSTPATGYSDAEKADLARRLSVQRKERHPSITSDPPSTSVSETLNYHPALDYLLRGKNAEERKEIMNDIDELIAAYQGLAVVGDRAAALASLTGQTEAQKRDTLAVLMEGGGKGNAALHEDALELLRKLPPTPGENVEYPADNHNILTRNDRNLDERGKTAQPGPVVSRWSSSSSIYSDHTVTSDPPSLYRAGSASSYGSDALPAEPPSPPGKDSYPNTNTFQHTTTQYWRKNDLQTPQVPPNVSPRHDSCAVAPLNVRSRPTTPTSDVYASRQKPLPPIKDTCDTLHEGSDQPRGHDHLRPNDEIYLRVESTLHPPTTTKPRSRSASPSSRSLTPSVTTPAQGKMMSSRPSKENNFWGFCKGAWAVRESIKKGLDLETRPNGMYSTCQVWQCKHCCFEGMSYIIPHATKPHKKETVVDPTIYTSSVGIRYRWIFLAKSHVRQTTPPSKQISATRRARDDSGGGTAFACLVCSVKRSVSGVFGNVEMLMNHIFMEHARPGRLEEEVLSKAGCVWGRVAGADEEWDFNVTGEDTCVVIF